MIDRNLGNYRTSLGHGQGVTFAASAVSAAVTPLMAVTAAAMAGSFPVLAAAIFASSVSMALAAAADAVCNAATAAVRSVVSLMICLNAWAWIDRLSTIALMACVNVDSWFITCVWRVAAAVSVSQDELPNKDQMLLMSPRFSSPLREVVDR